MTNLSPDRWPQTNSPAESGRDEGVRCTEDRETRPKEAKKVHDVSLPAAQNLARHSSSAKHLLAREVHSPYSLRLMHQDTRVSVQDPSKMWQLLMVSHNFMHQQTNLGEGIFDSLKGKLH